MPFAMQLAMIRIRCVLFFLCDSRWEREKEITLEDMGSDSDQDVYLMDETVLSDYIDDEGQRLQFVLIT